MILLINDDGIDAPGMRALYRALRRVTKQPVLAVAPAQERSGQAHAITLNRGLSVSARHDRADESAGAEGFFAFSIDGTPADCVKLALATLCHERPELVVSGVNDGPNVGRSIFYSGTVGAALEAAVEGHAAIAVSRTRGAGTFDDAAEFAAGWAARLLGRGDFRGQVLNINLPATPASAWGEARVAPHGRSGFKEGYKPTREGKTVAWRLHGEWVAEAGADETDASLLTAGHPVLTLLRPDVNAPDKALRKLLEARA
jgi:5'-nucleotidase